MTIALLITSLERINPVKTFRLYLLGSVAVVFGSALLSGCYTQLALNNDDQEAVVDSESTGMVGDLPTGTTVEPIIVVVPPPYYPLPIPVVSGPVAPPPATQPQQDQQVREIGNHRGPEASGSNGRTSGPTRGGR